MARRDLTDQHWAQIELLVPGKPGDRGRRGRDNRLFIDGILWIAREGVPWRNLPPEFGKWNSAFQRFRRWGRKGVWEQIFKELDGSPGFDYAIAAASLVYTPRDAAGANKGVRLPRSAAVQQQGTAKHGRRQSKRR